ncbi:MAG: synthase subunit [Deltaproteobacteria bacterium]|nr:synthase subunit [Deltaproteobacteria bacterium]
MRRFSRWLAVSLWVQAVGARNLWAAGGGGGFSGEVIWQIIAFVLLAFFLAKMLKKPLGAFLVKRKEQIRGSLDQASKKENEARKLFGEWEKKLQALNQEVRDLHESIRKEGEEERQKIVERAREEAERVRKQAQTIAEHEVKKARMALKKEMVDLSLEMAEKLLREKIQPQDQERLVREYIGKMRELR